MSEDYRARPSPVNPWCRERQVDEPTAVEVKGPREPKWRPGWLVAWHKRADDPDGPWWGQVQIPPHKIGYWRQDWIRSLPNA